MNSSSPLILSRTTGAPAPWLVANICIILGACSSLPTGSAARLGEARTDDSAYSESQSRVDIQFPVNTDISAYLLEVSSIPAEPILTKEKPIDAIAQLNAQQFQSTVKLVKSYQSQLEEFKDVASFLAANFTKSEAELRTAIALFDSQPGVLPIGNRIERFRSATRDIVTENEKIAVAKADAFSKFTDPIALPFTVLAQVLTWIPGPGRLRRCTTENYKTECYERSSEEHQKITTDSIGRAQQHYQAAVNGHAYIKHIDNTLRTIESLGMVAALPTGSAISLEEMTKREEFDYAFDVQSEVFSAPYSGVWSAVAGALRNNGHKFIVSDERSGVIITDLIPTGIFRGGRVQIYAHLSSLEGGSNKQGYRFRFKQFIYREQPVRLGSSHLVGTKWIPDYDRENRRKEGIELLHQIRERVKIK